MGDRKRRKQAFLAAHPICCFCGGKRPAETEDHVPARGIFDERRWPDGYNFPACTACNNLTRHDEKIVAMLARIMNANDLTTETQNREMRRAMAAVHYAFPEAYKGMRLSANEVRRFLKETGRSIDGYQTLGDFPLISIGQPEFWQALRAFGTKLFCALHYKHAGRIVPVEGVIVIRFFSNVQVIDGKIPNEILSVLGRTPILQRANTSLHEQFDYEYQVTVDKSMSLFLCGFRRSFALLGLVCDTDDLPEAFNEDIQAGKFRSKPFMHPG
ncbi:hypothetical protein I6F21_05885 [Bradyrhizobium sp. NBAIM03]|uniref:hypothetical protein n=1 Tax=Bradyrhizobium sp. NBAIM03 TaxID=2793816 RepID=UPI001CD3D7E7|nr:hypothetical protein [Bradyrhizobium sp. NBAIM03]MCA1532089.1 hypothetical protein [Bradyrhizobium sp. NBAIM03]